MAGHPTGGSVRNPNSLANLTPGISAIRHGVFLTHSLFLPCGRCPLRGACPHEGQGDGATCSLEAQYFEERRAELIAEGHIRAIDGPGVTLLLVTELRIMRLLRYLSVKGEVDEEKDTPTGVASHFTRLLSAWGAQADRLGIGPVARRAFEEKGDGASRELVKAFAELEAREKREQQQASDAEFSTEGDAE